MPGPPLPEIIAELSRAFPRDRLSQESARAYARHLADLPEDALALAVADLVRTVDRLPTIHQIRSAVSERLLQLPGEYDALAQLDARVSWARSRSGVAPEIHPLVRKALDAVGGFSAYRATDEPAVIRGQFLRLYRELRAGEIRDAETGRLALPKGTP